MESSRKILVKICGLKNTKEAEFVNSAKADFAGIVLFFPKSKRNTDLSMAEQILSTLDPKIRKVAVTVSPTRSQIEIIEQMGFDFIQIHGKIDNACFKILKLPVLKAFNVNDISEYTDYQKYEQIAGYVFDAPNYGGGKPFDWSTLDNINRDGKLFVLAGGLNAANVAQAIHKVHPDMVDVSSGVENINGTGKDYKKILEFVQNAKNCF